MICTRDIMQNQLGLREKHTHLLIFWGGEETERLVGCPLLTLQRVGGWGSRQRNDESQLGRRFLVECTYLTPNMDVSLQVFCIQGTLELANIPSFYS